jgi:hypothetical protein
MHSYTWWFHLFSRQACKHSTSSTLIVSHWTTKFITNFQLPSPLKNKQKTCQLVKHLLHFGSSPSNEHRGMQIRCDILSIVGSICNFVTTLSREVTHLKTSLRQWIYHRSNSLVAASVRLVSNPTLTAISQWDSAGLQLCTIHPSHNTCYILLFSLHLCVSNQGQLMEERKWTFILGLLILSFDFIGRMAVWRCSAVF